MFLNPSKCKNAYQKTKKLQSFGKSDKHVLDFVRHFPAYLIALELFALAKYRTLIRGLSKTLITRKKSGSKVGKVLS